MSGVPRLAVLLSLSGEGGVEKMVMNLLPEFVARGIAVDLLAIFRKPANTAAIEAAGVRVIDLGVRHSQLAVPALMRYLRAERPQALLAAKDRAVRTAVLARLLSGVPTRLVGRLGTNLSTALENKPAWSRVTRTLPMRWFYPKVDHIVAVSEGVAADTRALTGLPSEKLTVIRNPVVTPRMLENARAPVNHPWLRDRAVPVILGAGRLTVQKDFATLIRAFAVLRDRQPARLVILGEGRLRGELEALAAELDVADCVALPGYAENPHAWMAKADLFVLSSRWEGSPNVLTEALALGTPAVATDCPSGPREILADGRYGRLVPVGDVENLAAAMAATLADPLSADALRASVRDYHAAYSAVHYLDVLGLARPDIQTT